MVDHRALVDRADPNLTAYSLAPGHHLYPVGGGGWRYCTPEEKFVRVSGPDHLLVLAQQVAHGTLDRAAVELSDGDVVLFEQLVGALAARGLLAAAGERPSAAGRRVHVDGDNPIGDALAALLHRQCVVTRGVLDEGAVVAADVVVSCAGWLPDTYWLAVDRWCAEQRTPWHRCYVEGNRFVLGPLTVPGRTASYSDTRSRRLAASGTPDELAELWRHLDLPDGRAPVRWPGTECAVPAGLLATDVLAAAAGTPVPSAGHQLVLDLATARVDRHPVLPIPRVAG